jgi:hypothetical protein
MNDHFISGFFTTLVILRSYLSKIVVGGGWAPFMYYRYLIGDKLHTPILTSDIDLMVKRNIPTVGSKTIDQLLIDADLAAKFKTRDNPPVIHYEGEIDGVDVEIEFLTDQTGSQSDEVIEVQKGLHAEALRYISILVENTLTIKINDVGPLNDYDPIFVQVPTPAAYIFQKGLIFTRRRDKQKAAKDLYYIFDLLSGPSKIQKNIEAEYAVLSKKHARWFQKFIRNLKDYFESPDSEGSLRVVEQRPANAFPDLDDDQLKQFVFGTFEQFIKKLEPFGAS